MWVWREVWCVHTCAHTLMSIVRIEKESLVNEKHTQKKKKKWEAYSVYTDDAHT